MFTIIPRSLEDNPKQNETIEELAKHVNPHTMNLQMEESIFITITNGKTTDKAETSAILKTTSLKNSNGGKPINCFIRNKRTISTSK